MAVLESITQTAGHLHLITTVWQIDGLMLVLRKQKYSVAGNFYVLSKSHMWLDSRGSSFIFQMSQDDWMEHNQTSILG